MTGSTSVFSLPSALAAKADPALIGADEERFAVIAETRARRVADLEAQLAETLAREGGESPHAVQRDDEVRRLSAQLQALRRVGLDMVLGRIVPADGGAPVYIGRFGLTDADGERLLVDWRSPAAEPFFAATHAQPEGLASRRRYRWSGGRVTDYWDEVFTAEGLSSTAALDDQSAFIASLAASRSPRMRDVLSTIQADQDAIIRAGSRRALVVDGGPGTGKTVVALHRSAYLIYADPRLASNRGGVLFVGPSAGYLSYVSDVLPSLGEDGVQLCTLRELTAEGAHARPESDPEVARIKSDARMVRAIEAAARYYERPPTQPLPLFIEGVELWIDQGDWEDAFDAPDPGTPHNDGRDAVWEALVGILIDKLDMPEVPERLIRRALAHHPDLRRAFTRAWPVLDPAGVVGDLLSVPAFLRLCAPWLTPEQVELLHREDARAWTEADLPLIDAARMRIGDPERIRVRRRREAALERDQEMRQRVTDDLIAGDDDGDGLVTILHGEDAQQSLIDESLLPSLAPDELEGPFAHIVVDEAQELTDAQWQMLIRRCPSKSFTIVGDRAQARHGFAETWVERLSRVGVTAVEVAHLSVNYRTPAEIMAEAEPVIRAALPDANVPTSIRESGIPVRHASVAERDAILDAWLAEHPEGIACVIGDPTFASRPRVRSLTPELSKGLEFDLVVLVDPESFGEGIEGAVDRYVAMTRATERLVVLTR
ncbi:RNA polymerase recycling motor ATPase HelR [Salinibacterium sp. ZJ77]|uniref:RNA polymerase recycling motor ATPase HelR n=1 Tax=Salinibacterium sp. ZJ77 TaxID=2708337 RepID=UPI00141F04B2|nr:RNA polymerase recycling motor ATPase HelR [Salinibacterium sp. ZJ77]